MLDTVAVHGALERVVASAAFANSPRMSRFLRFVVEETAAGRASELKEYVVGVRVFDKAESFDPSIDPTVRVEASKLRAKLTRYYETEGRSDRILIDIPKGHYSASVRIRSEDESSVQARPETAPTLHRVFGPTRSGRRSPGDWSASSLLRRWLERSCQIAPACDGHPVPSSASICIRPIGFESATCALTVPLSFPLMGVGWRLSVSTRRASPRSGCATYTS
jgi:hypothetical protein